MSLETMLLDPLIYAYRCVFFLDNIIRGPVHDPEKHDLEWTQSRMDTIPNGHHPEWYHPEWAPSRMDTIPNGHNPEWTQSRMDTIPNEHLQLYSYFGV